MTTATDTPAGRWHAFWRWNVSHSPLARRIRAHRHATRLIAAAGLPAPVTARIDATVRRTRLWADERADVARELIAHAADALAAGRTEAETLASLGDPRPVARLIRRAVKRKRSWPYQLRIWTTRALAGGFALLLIAYAGLAIVYFTSRPTIKTNYLAKLNAPNEQYADDQRAHLVYHDVATDWRRIARPLRDASAVTAAQQAGETVPDDLDAPGVDMLPDLPEHHPDHDATVAAFRAFRPRLDDLAAATRLPVIGYPYSDRSEYRPIDGEQGTWPVPIPPSDDPAEQGPLIGVLLPYLGESRTLGRLLAFDARLAADEADPDRAVAALSAAIRMSAQLGRDPFLISQLVAHAVHHLALDHTLAILHDHPGLLTADHLTDLAHVFAAARDDALRLDFTGESYWVEDFLQRAYTDDGHGGGRLTPEGLRLLRELSAPSQDFGFVPDPFLPTLRAAASPALLATAPSRSDLLATHRDLASRLSAALHAGPPALPEFIDFETRAMTRPAQALTADPVRLLTPAFSTVARRWFQARARADALATILAIEAYRASNAHLPATLDALTPRYLPAIPEDPFDPGMPIKYRPTDTAYTVYFTGADADDDEGTPPPPNATQQREVMDLTLRYATRPPEADPPPDADWVIYPP